MTNEQTPSADLIRMTCGAVMRQVTELLRLACRRFQLRSVLDVLTTAPRSFVEAHNLEFQQDSFCFQCLADAYHESWDSLDDRAAYEAVKWFFEDDLPSLSASSRQAVEAAFLGILPELDLGEHYRGAESLRYDEGVVDVRTAWLEATP